MPENLRNFLYRMRSGLIHLLVKLLPQPVPMQLLGAGSSEQLCHTIARFNYRKVLLVTDPGLVEVGVIAPIHQALESAGIEVTLYGEVQPDPTDTLVLEGAAIARKHNCDAVLAVGGGSSIDAAKMIAVCAVSDSNPMESQMPVSKPGLGLFAVPTTAGTGAEVSIGAVITRSENHAKQGYGGAALIPIAVAIDPNLMLKLPAPITAATGIDALTHAIEAYIGRWRDPAAERYALSATRLIFENLPRACETPDDYAARESMAIAASYAGFAINRHLVGYVHAIAHQLGGRYGIPHGVANAVVLPHVLRFNKEIASDRLADLARAAGLDTVGAGDNQLAERFIEAVIALNQRIGIPEHLAEVEDVKAELVENALKEAGGYPVPRYMNREDCAQIFAAISKGC